METNQCTLDAETYVLAAGVWSTTVAKTLDLRLPLLAGKGYSLTLQKPRQLPNLCSILTEARVAVTPMGSALRFAGTLELCQPNSAVNRQRVQGITRAVSAYYPAFRSEDFANLPVWTGLRPVSPDGLPYLGRSRRWSNLIIATGHAMLGLSLGPVTGQIVADLAVDAPTGFDLRLLNVDRYA